MCTPEKIVEDPDKKNNEQKEDRAPSKEELAAKKKKDMEDEFQAWLSSKFDGNGPQARPQKKKAIEKEKPTIEDGFVAVGEKPKSKETAASLSPEAQAKIEEELKAEAARRADIEKSLEEARKRMKDQQERRERMDREFALAKAKADQVAGMKKTEDQNLWRYLMGPLSSGQNSEPEPTPEAAAIGESISIADAQAKFALGGLTTGMSQTVVRSASGLSQNSVDGRRTSTRSSSSATSLPGGAQLDQERAERFDMLLAQQGVQVVLHLPSSDGTVKPKRAVLRTVRDSNTIAVDVLSSSGKVGKKRLKFDMAKVVKLSKGKGDSISSQWSLDDSKVMRFTFADKPELNCELDDQKIRDAVLLGFVGLIAYKLSPAQLEANAVVQRKSSSAK